MIVIANPPRIVLTAPLAGYPAGTPGRLIEMTEITGGGRHPAVTHYIIEIDGRQFEVGQGQFKEESAGFAEAALSAFRAATWQQQSNLSLRQSIANEITRKTFATCFGSAFTPNKIEGERVEIDGLLLIRKVGPEDAFYVVKPCPICRSAMVSPPVRNLVQLGEVLAADYPLFNYKASCVCGVGKPE